MAHADIRYVLPSTTHPNDDFFRMDRERCFLKRAHSETRDSYLAPWVELIDLSELIEIGILPHPEGLAIAAWLRAR